MVDLTHEMAGLMTALGRPAQTRGRVFLFVAAFDEEGTSTVAREYARCEAAYAKRPVWLVDADLARQSQLRAVSDDPARFGSPGALSKASPDGSSFFTVSPPARDRDGAVLPDARLMIAQPFLERRLWVTRFLREKLPPGGKARLSEQADYWQGLRDHAQTIVIDTPAFARDSACLQLAPLADGVILVVSEDDGDVQARLDLRRAIERAGGRLIGMVYNRASRVSRLKTGAAGRAAAL
ncbi:MAG: transcriptional regulator [Asticcacaulis sp.]|uniref:transcriptional regulator n=1 Tax=Asticcacaulis sp. TaxID=1872648 RepID=UPI003F7BDFAD